MTDHLLESHEQGVATLTMNRPEARNAMSGPMMVKMGEAIPRLAQDPAVRCVVLTGAGGAFCAGGDVKGFAAADRGAGAEGPSFDARVWSLRQSVELSRQLYEMPKPTLAVIPGPAAGGGLSLALACDLRIALDTAKITTAFAKIGTSGDYGGSWFLTQLVGAAKARELYFSAEVLSGIEAHQLGIVNRVASADTFEQAARDWALELAMGPTAAIAMMKKNLNMAQRGTLSDVLDLESEHMTRSFMTDDHKASAQAFVEKRPPVFRGR